jgi:hypothetical protein
LVYFIENMTGNKTGEIKKAMKIIERTAN